MVLTFLSIRLKACFIERWDFFLLLDIYFSTKLLQKLSWPLTDSFISPIAYWGGVRCGNDVLPAGCIQTAVWKGNGKFSPCILLAECDALPKPVGKVKRLIAFWKSMLNRSQLMQFQLETYSTSQWSTMLLLTPVRQDKQVFYTLKRKFVLVALGHGNTKSSAPLLLSSR